MTHASGVTGTRIPRLIATPGVIVSRRPRVTQTEAASGAPRAAGVPSRSLGSPASRLGGRWVAVGGCTPRQSWTAFPIYKRP